MIYNTILTLITFLSLSIPQGQDDSKLYERKYIYMLAMDEEGKNAHSIKPLGKDVSISYKPFFKSYYIIYTGSDGQMYPLALDYYYTNNKGQHVVETRDNLSLVVFDNLSKNGDLSLVSAEPITRPDGIKMKAAFRITNQLME